jgi:hypothetical protein
MRLVIILTAFFFYNLCAISQTRQPANSSKSKTTKTAKSTNERLKSVTESHSGPGIENTGTTDIDVKTTDGKQSKSAKTKTGTGPKTTAGKSSTTKKKG